MWSRKTANSLLHPLQESARRPDGLGAPATADGLGDRFHLTQTVSLGLAAISDMTERMMLRAIR
jgi:hypothetical protein